MSLVHHPVQALGGRSHRALRGAAALVCCVPLLAGCGGSSSGGSSHRADYETGIGVGASIRSDDCTDWRTGSERQRRVTVVQLRRFAGSPVGSSAGIQNGRVLSDDRAYSLLQSFCANHFARGFKLYKLYERAAAFVGH